jgi:uncharacterized protein
MKTQETFVLCKGIGPKADEKIRLSGIHNWKMALENPERLPLSPKKTEALLQELNSLTEDVESARWERLIGRLPNCEHWRVLMDRQKECSYFDIETDGLSMYEGAPTVICCLHKGKMHTFIQGENLEDFPDLLLDIDQLVSFNGASFDVPYVQCYFNLPTLPCAHVDLRWICHHKGLKGGLKSIERDLGLTRDEDIHGVDGLEAVWLWERYNRYGDNAALKRLVKYCQADVWGLEVLARELIYL